MTQLIKAGFHGSDVMDWCGEYGDEADWDATLPAVAAGFKASIAAMFPDATVEVNYSNGITGLPWQHYAEGFEDDQYTVEMVQHLWGAFAIEDHIAWK